MKNITGNEDLHIPILLIPFYTILFVSGVNSVVDNLKNFDSVILSESIVTGDNAFGIFGELSWCIVPLMIIFLALKQKSLFLRTIYFIGIIPLLLTDHLIKAIGYKSLYLVKYTLIICVILGFIHYLSRTIAYYQDVIKKASEKDNLLLH